MKLTERKIERLTVEPGRKDRLVFDDEQRGLAVRVNASGGRSYIAQYTLAGVKHRVPLGSCAALSLQKARKAAAAIMGDVAKGQNPAIERKEAAARAKRSRDRLTLAGLIDQWERSHLSQCRPSYAAEATRALRFAFDRQLERPAEEMDLETVVRVLDGLTKAPKSAPAVSKPKGTAIASRTAAYGRALFGWASKRGSIDRNPFAALPEMASVPTRDRVLTDQELIAVLKAADDATAPYGQIVRMLILTGQRREEVAGMTWAEISGDFDLWTIPATRTKNGAVHVVPLPSAASKILRALLPEDSAERAREFEKRVKESSLVFPGRMGTPFSGWSKSKNDLDIAAGVSGWRIHDLRRTLATGLQRLGVRLEVTEAVLNHVSGTRAGIVGVYQRHDWKIEKRAALDAWARHVEQIVDGAKDSGNVVRVNF